MATKKELDAKLDEIKALLQDIDISSKEILNLEETSIFLGIIPSTLYKMTSRSKLPYYRPNGRKLYFKKEELINWMEQNKHHTDNELTEIAKKYIKHSKH